MHKNPQIKTIDMNKHFAQILRQYNWRNKYILVALSGGVDSMVLAHLLLQAGVRIAVAHCNFGLRAAESDADEQFVTNWATQHRIPIFVQHFHMKASLQTEGGNVQEMARTLRYTWFYQLLENEKFDCIATAHHQQDNAETVLINLFKGTGIAGLHGILPEQNSLIRPLLSFAKSAIIAYANENGIAWREDSSNQQDKYLRNAIRQHILPAVEQVFPHYLTALYHNTQRLREVELLYQESVQRYTRKLVEQRGKEWYLPVLKLQKIPALATVLWEIIKPFGFHAAQLNDVKGLTEAASGRFVASNSHRIVKDRNFLIITPLTTADSTYIWVQHADTCVSTPQFSLHLQSVEGVVPVDALLELNKHEICVDTATLTFPLLLRPWKQGDYFYPIGMQHKKKKVSKLLIEQKIPLHQKDKIWVLESNQRIVWILGIRADERFKITQKTVNSCLISVKELHTQV